MDQLTQDDTQIDLSSRQRSTAAGCIKGAIISNRIVSDPLESRRRENVINLEEGIISARFIDQPALKIIVTATLTTDRDEIYYLARTLDGHPLLVFGTLPPAETQLTAPSLSAVCRRHVDPTLGYSSKIGAFSQLNNALNGVALPSGHNTICLLYRTSIEYPPTELLLATVDETNNLLSLPISPYPVVSASELLLAPAVTLSAVRETSKLLRNDYYTRFSNQLAAYSSTCVQLLQAWEAYETLKETAVIKIRGAGATDTSSLIESLFLSMNTISHTLPDLSLCLGVLEDQSDRLRFDL
jgi:hypothetical protein